MPEAVSQVAAMTVRLDRHLPEIVRLLALVEQIRVEEEMAYWGVPVRNLHSSTVAQTRRCGSLPESDMGWNIF